MLKRIIAMSLSLTIFSLQASTNVEIASLNNGLGTAFNNLKFGLEVEWDQQNKEQYKEIIKNFQDEVKTLQAQGLSNQDLISYIKENVLDESQAKDLDLLMTSINLNKMSSEEASKLAMEHFSKNYAQGSNWRGRGRVAGLLAITAVLLAVTALAIVVGAPATSTGPRCYDEYVCYDYYDAWGYYLYTDCFWETYCY